LAFIWLTANVAFLRAEDERKLDAKARIVQINPETRQLILRTKADQKLVVFADEQTKLRLNDRLVRLADLKEGSEVAIVYQAVGGKNMLSALTVASSPQEGATVQESPSRGTVGVIRAPKESTIKGVITKVMPANNEFIVKMSNGHEEVLYLENKNGSVADLEEGAEVTVTYQMRNLVVSVAGSQTKVPKRATPAVATESAAGFSTMEGTIFNAFPNDNFFILKTPRGHHLMFINNSTRMQLNNKKMTLKELTVGTPISVRFQSMNGQNMVSSISAAQAPKATGKSPK
jgi:Cu/Ag efflux protein CusF